MESIILLTATSIIAPSVATAIHYFLTKGDTSEIKHK